MARRPRPLEIGIRVDALQHHGRERRVGLARAGFRGLDVGGGVHCRHRDLHVLGETDLDVTRPAPADRLDRQAVCEHRMVPHLVQLAIRELERRREEHPMGLAATDVGLHALVPVVGERAGFIEGEDVLDAIVQLLGDVPGVLGEGLDVSADCQPPWRSCSVRGRSQWKRVANGSIPTFSNSSTKRL